MNSNPDYVKELMMLEFGRLQESIDKFDDLRFKMRGWAITAAGALFAVSVNSRESVLAFAGAVLVLFFGYLEVVYMNMEIHAIEACNRVEQLLQGARQGLSPEHEAYVFGVGKTFAGSFHVRNIPGILHQRHHITAFYVGLMLSMVLGALLVHFAMRPPS